MLDTDEHLAVKVAWRIYQKIIAAYADPNRHRGKRALAAVIDSIRHGVPTGLEEIAQLGRTLWRRRTDSSSPTATTSCCMPSASHATPAQ